jgi:hypothetical protein
MGEKTYINDAIILPNGKIYKDWDFESEDEEFNNWIDRRDKAESLVYEAREYIFPELQGRGHSYGIGRDLESNIAWNIHQVLRYYAGNDERKPYAVYGELPEIEVLEE